MYILYFEGDRNWDALKWLCEEKKERVNQTVSALAMMETPLSISNFSSLNFLDFSWVSYRIVANSFFFVMVGCVNENQPAQQDKSNHQYLKFCFLFLFYQQQQKTWTIYYQL